MEKKKHIPNFQVPKDYFEDFEEQLFTKIEEGNLPKSAGFTVPHGYFDQVEQEILTAVKPKEPTKVIPLFSKKNLGYIAAIAASLVIGVSLIFPTSQEQITLDTINLSAIDSYIEDGNLNLDLYDLMSYLNDSDLSNIDFDMAELSDLDLEGYLQENTNENFWSEDSFDAE